MFVFVSIWMFVYLCYKFYKHYTYWTNKGIKNVSVFHWFKILTENIMRSVENGHVFQLIYQEYKNERCVGAYHFNQPILLIRDLNLIKKITVQHYNDFSSHSYFIPTINEQLWEDNIFFLNNNKWSQLRKTLSSVFSGKRLRLTLTEIENRSAKLNEFLKTEIKNKENVFDVKNVFNRLFTDIMAYTTFGIASDSLNNINNEFYIMCCKSASFPAVSSFQKYIYFLSPKLAKVLNIRVINNEISTFLKGIVKDGIAHRLKHNIQSNDVLDVLIETSKSCNQEKDQFVTNKDNILCENNKNCTNLNITSDLVAAQTILFLFAGVESVSSVLSYICYHLALNSHIQEKLLIEIQNALDTFQKITPNNLNSLEYLDCVVSEVLRLHPPSSILDRLCVNTCLIESDNPQEQPIHVDKGTWVWIMHRAIQHDEKYFPNPEMFDPDRFSSDNKYNILENSYIPFGMGPKLCMGNRFGLLEIKILVINLLLNFEFSPAPQTKLISDYGTHRIYPIHNKGLWLRLSLRN